MTVTIEYVAGFFDGEGCIGLYSRKYEGVSCYQWMLTFTNTNREVIDEVFALLGVGTIRTVKHDNPAYRDCYNLRICGRHRVLSVLELLFPYLIVKREEAARAMTLARQIEATSWRGERNGNASLTNLAVEEIRNRYAVGDISQEQLGKEYGVSQGTISLIAKGKAWTDVAGPLTDGRGRKVRAMWKGDR